MQERKRCAKGANCRGLQTTAVCIGVLALEMNEPHDELSRECYARHEGNGSCSFMRVAACSKQTHPLCSKWPRKRANRNRCHPSRSRSSSPLSSGAARMLQHDGECARVRVIVSSDRARPPCVEFPLPALESASALNTPRSRRADGVMQSRAEQRNAAECAAATEATTGSGAVRSDGEAGRGGVAALVRTNLQALGPYPLTARCVIAAAAQRR